MVKEKLEELKEERAKELQKVSEEMNELLEKNNAELRASKIDVDGQGSQFRIEIVDKLGLI